MAVTDIDLGALGLEMLAERSRSELRELEQALSSEPVTSVADCDLP